MDSLQDEILKVKRRIEKYGSKGINEQDTKATLIQPIMRALGWDVEDLEDVQREYKRRKQDKPVDYALFLLRTPCLFIEAKALGQNLDDRKWANQIMGYAGVAGVGWVVLTDGNEYRLYNTHATVPIEEKLFRSVRISDDTDATAETLALLSKGRMTGNEIDTLWNSFFVDRQVKAVIEELVTGEPDASFLRLLAKRLDGLKPRDIRTSLQRAEISLSFPLAPPADSQRGSSRRTPARARRSEKTAPKRSRKTRSPSGELVDMGVHKKEQIALLMREGLLKTGQRITTKYRGKQLEATLTKDGKVKFEGGEYDSLSSAGAAAKHFVSGKERLATDGWTFWATEDGSGESVPLRAIRERYLETLS